VDSPGEEDAGGGYCPERGVHTLRHVGAHVLVRAVQEAKREVTLES
jgi:hypothetical protein